MRESLLRMTVLALLALLALLPVAAAMASERVALVIGNNAYQHGGALNSAVNDAQRVGDALQGLGFRVIRRQNLNYTNLLDALDELGKAAAGADWAVVYYAGHGIQVQGKNHLIPVDVGLNREGDLRRTVLLDDLLAEVNQARELGLVILDACRDNPFAARLNQGAGRSVAGRGLARVEQTGNNTLVAFATREDAIAADSGVYAAALVEYLATPGLELRQLFGKVRDAVMARTGNGQQPYIYGSLGGGYYTFKSGPSPPLDGNRDPEVVFWDSVKDSRNSAVFRIYLERYPNGTFAELAHIRLAELERPVSISLNLRTVTGQDVYRKVCVACHATGALGAPKIGDKDLWEPRVAQGMDTLVNHAVNGIRVMPAKGGDPTLSETNIKDAIVYMLGETGIKTDLVPKVNNRLNDKGHEQSFSPLRKKWSTKLETFEKGK